MRLPSNILIKTLLRAVLADESLVERVTIDGKEYATFSRAYKKGTEVVTLAIPIPDTTVQADELPRNQQNELPRSQSDIGDGRGGKSPLDTGTMEKSSNGFQKSEWVPPANSSSGMKYPSMQDTFMRKRFEQARMKRESLVQVEATVQAEPSVESKSTDEEERVARLRQAGRQTESYLKNYTYEPTLPVEPSTVEEETAEYGEAVTRQPFALEYQEWKFLLHCCASLTECSTSNTHSCIVTKRVLTSLSIQHRQSIVENVSKLLETIHLYEKDHLVSLCTITRMDTGIVIAWGNRCIVPGKVIGWYDMHDTVLAMRDFQKELQYDVLRMVLRGLKTVSVASFICEEYGQAVFDAIRMQESVGKTWYRRIEKLAKSIAIYTERIMVVPAYESSSGKLWTSGKLVLLSRTESGSVGDETEYAREDMG